MPFKKLLKKQDRKQKSSVRLARRARSTAYRGNPHFYSNKLSYDELIEAESELGKTIFGPIPEGHQRKFFEYRKNVWIWHESFMDPNGVMQDMTVRYEVRPDGVFKRPGNSGYRKIEGVELDNFRKAAQAYLNLVKTKLYS